MLFVIQKLKALLLHLVFELVLLLLDEVRVEEVVLLVDLGGADESDCPLLTNVPLVGLFEVVMLVWFVVSYDNFS